MKKDDHYLVGSLLKSSGIKGEIILKFNNDCPEEIQKLESIFIDIDNKLVPFFIEEIKPKSNTTAIVKLEGIDSEPKTVEFIGLDFYISLEQKEELLLEAEEYLDIDGYLVFDENHNELGEVIEFIDIPENPLLNVKTQDGEILIPAKDELIIEIDDDSKRIVLTVPEGLHDLD